MSFQCNDCHLIATGNLATSVHFSGSYGPCETCGITDHCGDCKCHGNWGTAREAGKIRYDTLKAIQQMNKGDDNA
jgi:hypothetical protein